MIPQTKYKKGGFTMKKITDDLFFLLLKDLRKKYWFWFIDCEMRMY